MSEAERRRKYRYNRVLIETARILSTTFPDAVIRVTGAQLELLRNLMEYLNRQETFVTTYDDGYYLSPTIGEWDSLLAIVADLEEVLMGNKNVVWGYSDRWHERLYHTCIEGGTYSMSFDPVPDGSVYVLQGVAFLNVTRDASVTVYARFGGQSTVVVGPTDSVANVTVAPVFTPVTMKHGDYVRIHFFGCVADDILQGDVRGYEMQVPITI